MEQFRRLDQTLSAPWSLRAACASGAMLLAAHAFETFGRLAPCHLCLYQRDAYWTALGVGAVGTALRGAQRPVAALLTLIFLAGAATAAYHAGVEWKWWPGPSSCTGGGVVNAGQLSAFLHGARIAPPRCDEAPWRFLGLSMAGYNAAISLGLAGLSARTTYRTEAPSPKA